MLRLPSWHINIVSLSTRTGLDDKELTTHHTNNEAFKKRIKWLYDHTVKEGIFHITALDAFYWNCQYHSKKPLSNSEGMTHHQPGEWWENLIPGARGLKQQPSSFFLHQAFLASSYKISRSLFIVCTSDLKNFYEKCLEILTWALHEVLQPWWGN